MTRNKLRDRRRLAGRARIHSRIIEFSRSVPFRDIIGIEPTEDSFPSSSFFSYRRNTSYFRPVDYDDTEIANRIKPENDVQLYSGRATAEEEDSLLTLACCGTVFQNYSAPRWLRGHKWLTTTCYLHVAFYLIDKVNSISEAFHSHFHSTVNSKIREFYRAILLFIGILRR